ncbi:MAG: PHP domain-containing protein, partial [Clostridia bacterium]|nr:PHP domain-containing protein [Clostridia bacterium]
MSPTTLKLENIFGDTVIPPELADALVYSTNGNASERTMVITVASDKLIAYDIIEDFKKYIKNKFKLNSFLLKVKYINTSLEQLGVEEYYKNLVFYVNEVINGVRHLFLDSSASLEDGVLTISCRYGVDLLNDMQCGDTIKRLVASQTGETVDVVFEDNSSREEYDQALEETLSNLPVIEAAPPKEEKKEEKPEDSDIIYGRKITEEPIGISDIPADAKTVVIAGKVIFMDSREVKNEKTMVKFYLADDNDAFTCKTFIPNKKFKEVKGELKAGKSYVKVKGRFQYDTFDKENIIMVNDIAKAKKAKGRMDNAAEKRVELHMHTKMSQMDAMTDAKDLVENAISWGHKAVAITDHGNVQAFPEAYHAAGDKIKILYGVECYLVDDSSEIVTNGKDMGLNGEYVVFDLETTGLSPNTEAITEIGAVRVKDGQITDTFNEFVNPGKPIPPKIVELTGITDDMVADAPSIDAMLPKFYDFVGDSVLVAHNAGFDTSFIKKAASDCGMEYNFTVIDTLDLARCTVPELKKHNLAALTKHFNIKLENHHRACDDAMATAHVFLKLVSKLEDMDVTNVNGINEAMAGKIDIKALKTYH